jgi:nitrate reductase NapAB chaperone NapD
MTPINLHQEQQFDENSPKKTRMVSTGIIIGSLVVIITLAVWGVCSFLSDSYKKKNDILKLEIDKQKNALASGEQIDKIADFKKRTTEIENNLSAKEKESIKNILQDVSANMLSGTILESYAYNNKGEIVLVINSDNFQTIAKQVMQFKSFQKFSEVVISDMKRAESVISFNIAMKYKN